MNRNLSAGILIICFSATSLNTGWAADNLQLSPIVVQPGGGIEQEQMMDQDRRNRDQEIAIKDLMDQNDRLAEAAGMGADPSLQKYRDDLYNRDRARIEANGEIPGGKRYGDLVALTEDADVMTEGNGILAQKSGLLAEKYQMLTALKDEMTALNNKLEGENRQTLKQKQDLIDGYKKLANQQQDKIQMLIQRLDAMDKKISRFDEIMAAKDRQINRLSRDLEHIRQEASDAKNQAAQLNLQLSTAQSQVRSLTEQLKEKPVIQENSNPIPNREQTSSIHRNIAQKNEEIRKLRENLGHVQADAADKQNQIELLKSELENTISGGKPPAAAPVSNQLLLSKNQTIRTQQTQISQLKSQLQELSSKGTNMSSQEAKERTIRDQQDQIALLKSQLEELITKETHMESQAGQLSGLAQKFRAQKDVYQGLQDRVLDLKRKIIEDNTDLQSRDRSIHWLNQMLSVSKDKAKYYQLTAQQATFSMKDVQAQIQELKDDLSGRLKNYNDVQQTLIELKSQMDQKQNQINDLKSRLAQKDNEVQGQKDQAQRMQQNMQAQLADKDNQIAQIRSFGSENLKLAQQLIDLHQQQEALLEEKSRLTLEQYDIFDRHFTVFERRMNVLLENNRLQKLDLSDQVDALRQELVQQQQEADNLKKQLEENLATQQNQDALQAQIKDLQSRLQAREDQMSSVSRQSAHEFQVEESSLRHRLAKQQDDIQLLKQELENKINEAKKLTVMLKDYQGKLESKNTAYNEELGQTVATVNTQVAMQKQMRNLNDQLQIKQAEIVKLRQSIYSLRNNMTARYNEAQTRDLNLSMIQQKMVDAKIDEYRQNITSLKSANLAQAEEIRKLKSDLALSQQELKGVPSADELVFLRTGLQKATSELKQKDEMLSQAQADSLEYQKEFKSQSAQFTSLRVQLRNALAQLDARKEDIRYKNMEIIRLRLRSHMGRGDLEEQIKALTQKLDAAEKQLHHKIYAGKPGALQEQLDKARDEIKQLQAELDMYIKPSRKNTLNAKLKQALAKIDEQGRIISVLAQKLQAAGQTVDVRKVAESYKLCGYSSCP